MTIKANALMILVPVSSLLLGACDPPPTAGETADQLPETLATSAGDLVATRSEGALATRAVPVAPGRGAVPLVPPKSRYCSDEYVGYVVFPMTICTPPNLGVEGTALASVAAPSTPSAPPVASLGAELNGLSTVSADALKVSPFCHVSGGPWFADVVTTESCVMGIPDRSGLSILAAPQPFSVTWDGDLSSVPPPFNPNAFGHVGTTCACCPGFLPCLDGRCLPHGFSCDNNGPPL